MKLCISNLVLFTIYYFGYYIYIFLRNKFTAIFTADIFKYLSLDLKVQNFKSFVILNV